jgi:prepilin-type N-terminal cleavage/methylation domain-containing protein
MGRWGLHAELDDVPPSAGGDPVTLRARPGLTLMELMVAIAITALMTAAGYGAFAAMIDQRRLVAESTVHIERAVALRELIDDWIAGGQVGVPQGGGPRGMRSAATSRTSARMAASTAPIGVTSAAVTNPDAELTVTTNALTPSGSPGTRVRLYIDEDDATPETGLTIEYQASQATPLERRELDPTVTEMLVEFLDQLTGRWVRAAEGATIDARAVRITLGSDDESFPAIARVPYVRAMTDQSAPVSQRARVRR